MSRPEHLAPPDVFYDEKEAQKYSSNSRMIEIQSTMSSRALELLALPEGQSCFLLDIGCGSGLSGTVLSEAGHVWVGVDISKAMLDVAVERGVTGGDMGGDMCLLDMGHGMPFRPGSFDGAISVSALQWLCNRDKTEHVPQRRMKKFFETLYFCLARGSRAVFQFYPESPDQVQLLTSAAMRCGFTGGLVVDYPNSTKAKKFFLCLFAGTPPGGFQLPKALEGDPMDNATQTQLDARKRARRRRAGKKGSEDSPAYKSRAWVLKKKERQRQLGKNVRPDTRYTARRRPGAF
jgi:18S rRNA (guanine1575-N7)-methyltransferase